MVEARVTPPTSEQLCGLSSVDRERLGHPSREIEIQGMTSDVFVYKPESCRSKKNTQKERIKGR